MSKIIIGLDGMDRTGKSSIGHTGNITIPFRFGEELDKDFTCFSEHENRYSTIAKECFKDRWNGLSAKVSHGVAIAELIEGIEHLNDSGCDGLIMPRTFASSIVYMCMRGDYTDADILMQDIRLILEKFDIAFIGFYLEISKETMMSRGSKEDSYEIVKYDEILKSIDYCTRRQRCTHTHLERVDVEHFTINTTLNELIDRTKMFIDLGGRNMDHHDYAREYVYGK